jgi:hypothetical protein
LEETMFDEGETAGDVTDAVGDDGLTVDHGSTSWLYSEMVASNRPNGQRVLLAATANQVKTGQFLPLSRPFCGPVGTMA